MALASRQGHTRTLQPLSSPPRLLCRSPGPGPSVASLSCPRPHISRVFKLTPARDLTERARDCPRWTPSEAIARAFRRSSSAPSTVICLAPQPSCTRRMDAVIICRPCLPKFGATAANSAFRQFIATRPGADEAASQLTTSPFLSLSWPRPISIKSDLSQTVLILGDEAHSGSHHGSAASHTPVSATDTAGTHSHFTHAQTQPHQSTALLRMGKVHHLVTQVASGSSLHSAPLQRSRALATTARRRQALRSVWWTCCGHSRPSHAARTRIRHLALSSRSWRRV